MLGNIKATILNPCLLGESFGNLRGAVFGNVADEDGNETSVTIRTNIVKEYDINAERTEVMVTTNSGSNYKVVINPEDEDDVQFTFDLLKFMGDK